MLSVGFEDGTINVYQVANLVKKLPYKEISYRVHEISVCDQEFIGSEDNYRLASIDFKGKFVLYCL